MYESTTGRAMQLSTVVIYKFLWFPCVMINSCIRFMNENKIYIIHVTIQVLLRLAPAPFLLHWPLPPRFDDSSYPRVLGTCRILFTVPPKKLSPTPYSHLSSILNFLSSWRHFLNFKCSSLSKVLILWDGHAQMQVWITEHDISWSLAFSSC